MFVCEQVLVYDQVYVCDQVWLQPSPKFRLQPSPVCDQVLSATASTSASPRLHYATKSTYATKSIKFRNHFHVVNHGGAEYCRFYTFSDVCRGNKMRGRCAQQCLEENIKIYSWKHQLWDACLMIIIKYYRLAESSCLSSSNCARDVGDGVPGNICVILNVF